jgi:GxxExxY protein
MPIPSLWQWDKVSRRAAKYAEEDVKNTSICRVLSFSKDDLSSELSLKMKLENELATIIVDLCFKVHQQYGPGLLERVYEEILFHELTSHGFKVERQKWIPLSHKGLYVANAFRADLIIDDLVLLELKSVDELPKCYYKIVITYLKLTGLKLGFLVNFKVGFMKEGIHRIVNNL